MRTGCAEAYMVRRGFCIDMVGQLKRGRHIEGLHWCRRQSVSPRGSGNQDDENMTDYPQKHRVRPIQCSRRVRHVHDD